MVGCCDEMEDDMAYDEIIAERLRNALQDTGSISERKMFGGLCIMLNGNMLCGVLGSKLMVRVGKDAYERLLNESYARKLDFTGKEMKGILFVDENGIESDDNLKDWLDRALDFVRTLPEK